MSPWLQEFFFTPFAARGRVSRWKGRESNLFKAPKIPRPRLKCPEWLSTQDCPPDEKRRGKTGADLDRPRCVCAVGAHTSTRLNVLGSLAFLPEYVHPGPCLETTLPALGALWWRPEEVQFPILALDLQLEMAAC